MKYLVTVQRIEYKSHDFEVEAASREEAKELGYEMSNDYDFGDSSIQSADESVIGVREVEEKA